MLRKIFILIVVDLCIKCHSQNPYAHGLSRRSVQKRTEAPPPEPSTVPPTAPTTVPTTVPPTAPTTVPTTVTTAFSKRTPIPKRKPEIGANPVASLGALAAPELQWHAAIYEKTTTPYSQICGGTVVTSEFVISAAHCFWSDGVGAMRPALFAVAAGKLLRTWDASSDEYAQQSDIESIHIPARFRGGATHFQADLALLRLSSPLQYAAGVRPACVSFDPELEGRVLLSGNPGTITGFGLIAEDGGPSARLTVLELPYIDIDECFAKVDPSFVKYLSSDKICAGYWEAGKALCRGDSGGGLIYTTEIQDSWKTAPYLLGIASTAQRNKNECNAFTPASFTNIIAHSNFLKQLVPGLEDECRYVYLGVNRESERTGRNETEARGKRRPVNLNGLLAGNKSSPIAPTPSAPVSPSVGAPTSLEPPPAPNSPSVGAPTSLELPPAPNSPSVGAPTSLQPPALEWYAAVYNKSTTPYTQICGASVVKQDVVISAAHCFWGRDGILDASLFAVAAGKLLQPWGVSEDAGTWQQSDVASIHVPARYRDVSSNYQGDVAALRLRTPLRYSAAVRPVCVSFDQRRDDAAFCRTSDGSCFLMMTGWASVKHKHAPSGRLRYLEIPVTDTAQCRTDIEPSFRKYLTRDKVCVGFMSTALALCDGDIGGGLVRYSSITNSSILVPFLHGVASTMERDGEKCAVPVLTPASFTHLLYHRDFLEELIPELEDECRYVYLGERRPGQGEIRQGGDVGQSGRNETELLNATRVEAKLNVTTQSGSSDISASVPSQIQTTSASAANPASQATMVMQSPNTPDIVLITVTNGSIRITVTAVKSVTLELQKP